jgi:hypothetical protein
MKIFTWRSAASLCFISLSLVTVSCKDDEPAKPVITAYDLEVTMDENPKAGDPIGTPEVSTDKGSLSFSLQSESVNGAFAVNSTTGALTVSDPSKFDFETNPTLTAVLLAKNGKTELPVNVEVNLQKVIWEGANITFTKASNADWTLAANQDKITDLVTFTRQNKGPLYNYQWWQDNFDGDAAYIDLSDDFWNNTESTREFTREGGTKGVRWALLDNTGGTTETWNDFQLYGTLGDPTHFYSFHNIASIITDLENGTNVVSVIDDFSHELEGGQLDESASTEMTWLVGKKLGVWLVEEDIYLTLTFTEWGSGGTNTVSYTRSTKD